MTLREPESMDECLYFTRRKLENDGWARAWVYRPLSPDGNPLGKPKDPKTGKVKIRSKVYVDHETGYEVSADELDLNVEIKYKSPFTGEEGETTVPFKWKTYQGVKSIVFLDSDGNKIALTKKMSAPKKKK
ncbi:MAG: hypothetical protein OXR66_02185 [Candidatus Woesearchaeota archaeon]|nr:hypothetical protein [Candidatus Woesearchaeota archaeon]